MVGAWLEMLRVQRLAWCLALCTASTALLACCEGDEIRWDLYHKSDAILDFFKKTALKLPTRVRWGLMQQMAVLKITATHGF